MIDVWDWEITVRDWKITTWDYKITVWEIRIAIREWKNVMRDHIYQSRMKNCHVRSILTVDNEKSLSEKKKSPFEIIDWFFLSRWDISSQRRVFWRDFPLSCGQYKNTDYGLQTTMASQTWQKWVELKITYRVSVIDMWDWEITVRDWKITTWE